MEDVRVLLVELGERADAIGAQELVFVEHLRQDPAQPLRVDQGQDPALRHAKVSRARGVDGLQKFGHPAQAFVDAAAIACGTRSAATCLDDRCGAQRQESHHRAHLEPRGAAVREPQQVVVEAVLLIPHAVLTGPVHGRRRYSRSARRTL